MSLKAACGLDLPSLFDISELCNPGSSAAILRRWMRDQTMKAFMGRFTLSAPTDISPFFKNPLCLRGNCCLPTAEIVFRIASTFRRIFAAAQVGVACYMYLSDGRRGDAYCRFPCFSSHGRPCFRFPLCVCVCLSLSLTTVTIRTEKAFPELDQGGVKVV